MKINNAAEFFKHLNVPEGDIPGAQTVITAQALLHEIRVQVGLDEKYVATSLSHNGNIHGFRNYYPFTDEDFWKAVDAAAEELLEKVTPEDDDPDDWLDYDLPWD